MSEPLQNLPNLEMSEEVALLAALQQDISQRLKHVCGHMDEGTFNELVRDIAIMKIKYGSDSDVTGSLRTDLHTLLDSETENPLT